MFRQSIEYWSQELKKMPDTCRLHTHLHKHTHRHTLIMFLWAVMLSKTANCEVVHSHVINNVNCSLVNASNINYSLVNTNNVNYSLVNASNVNWSLVNANNVNCYLVNGNSAQNPLSYICSIVPANNICPFDCLLFSCVSLSFHRSDSSHRSPSPTGT